jgi:peroxiredoxin
MPDTVTTQSASLVASLATTQPQPLNAQFAALHSERERTWEPAQLRKNIDQRRALEAAYDPATHIKAGDTLPDFILKDVEGGLITRLSLEAHKGAVLIFFRFAGCPACNLALPYYEQTLWPALNAKGYALIAISPQVPDKLIDIKTRHKLGFTVASDPQNALGNALGITFAPEDKPAIKPGENWIGETTGTNSWTLPQPTVIVTDHKGRVKFVEVSPDWLKRTESEAILAAL